ncbi:retrovirus-related pol polyprotein from transposon TNT 1-94 [Tanacetum coccineum]
MLQGPKKLEKSHDPCSAVALTEFIFQKHIFLFQTNIILLCDTSYTSLCSNAQNETGNVQRTLRTPSSCNTSTVQCYNFSGKGHYARNCPKPRVRDSKYFMEQMLLAKQDEAGVILSVEQNDFLFDDASRMKEIEELSANICLMARIQSADHTSDDGPSYESAFISKVVQIVPWVVDSGCSKHMTGHCTQLLALDNIVEGDLEIGLFVLIHVTYEIWKEMICSQVDAILICILSPFLTWLLLHPFVSCPKQLQQSHGYVTKDSHMLIRGKSKKASHPPKLVPSDHSKLELLHMDLCGPMRLTFHIFNHTHEAPPVVTTSDEQTSPISLTEADEFHQEDTADFDSNAQFIPYNPPCHEEKFPDYVYRLKKALYGLKQAPRAWYDKLSSFIIEHRLTKEFQSQYAIELLKKHGLDECVSMSTPMATKRLDADLQGTPTDQTTYRRMIGGLMYLTTSRPDIAFATFVCARYQARPTVKHLKEVKRIFRYLRQSYNMGLWYPKDSGFELIAYSDADHAGCKDDCKSTSGGLQFLGGKLVSWSSKKQDCTAMSTAEAEYVSLSACCAQVIWMRTQLLDYGYKYNRIPMYYDSKSAIAISCNPIQHSKTKHIDIRYHFIKEHVEKGTVEIYFVGTEYQLADLFTKALPKERFEYLVHLIDMGLIIMAQQQDAADVHPDELCPPNKRYDLMDANKKVDLDHFWHTLKEDGSKYRLRFMLDKKELTLTLDEFRQIFHLP